MHVVITPGRLGDRLAFEAVAVKVRSVPGSMQHSRASARGPVVRALAIIILAIFGFFAASGSPAFAKYAAVIMDAATGEVVYAANPDARHYPASLTKVMTLFVTFDALKAGRISMDSMIKVSGRAARQPASRLGLEAGDRIKLRDAVLALVVKSANDAASALGEHLGGSERKFAALMNAKAAAIGLENTSFRNASGLPNRQQLTTARDFAKLVRALQRQHPEYYKLFSTRSFTFRGRKHDNHNRLLDRYEGADGVKTGYIRASGFNLAASARRAGHRLIGVVMGASSPQARDLHMMGLLERGFEKTTAGTYIAYDYDRSIQVDPSRSHANPRKKIERAKGARGVMRLARLTPPKRPVELVRPTGEGSTYQPELPAAPEASPMDWEIQVGTFSHRAPAHELASRAKDRLPSLLAHVRINIVTMQEGGTTLYRARLAGLDSDNAERACELLRAKAMPCYPIAPENAVSTPAAVPAASTAPALPAAAAPAAAQ
jgi:D-alanyl-D-alanine carboxypeptidase